MRPADRSQRSIGTAALFLVLLLLASAIRRVEQRLDKIQALLLVK